MGLEVEAREKEIGSYRADILCRSDNELVIIENQLERTDHKHLGQILTYAAGIQASTLIWIAKNFTEEHRAAIDWLNEKSELNLIALEIELWKISDSLPAPKFNIVAKPNNWTKSIHALSEMTEIKQLQYNYWNSLTEFLINSKIKLQKPRAQNYIVCTIGHSEIRIQAICNTNLLVVNLYIDGDNAKQCFQSLQERKEEIESNIGCSLQWQELPHRMASKISVYRSADIFDKSLWNEYHEWHKTMIERFYNVFRPMIKNL